MTSHRNECSECRKPCAGITCSTKCRKRRQRRRQEAQLVLPLVVTELGKIRACLKRREDVPHFIEQLKRLKGEVNDLLLFAGDEDALSRHEMLTEVARKRSV